MLGLGLKPRNVNGAPVLPELAAADNFNASARVAGPDSSPGLGLAKPAALPASPSQPVDAPPVPSPDMPPPSAAPAAAGPPSPAQDKTYYDFENNPVRSIGRAMAEFAAGYQGQSSPAAAWQKRQIEDQAQAFKSAELGMNVIEAATKQLKGRPGSEHAVIIADFQKRFGPLVGQITPLLTAISNGQIQNAQEKIELGKQLGIFTPAILDHYKNDPDGLDKLLSTVMEHKATEKTPTQLAADAAATARGTKAGGKSPAELAADAAATNAATQKTPAQLEADAAATARGTKAGNPDKTPAQIEADAAARARGEAAGSGAKMTDAQATAAIYADRASQAEAILTDVAHVGTNYWQHVRASSPGGNYLVSPEYQRFDQAKRNFVTAVLRKESGAVISPDEMKQADQQYFPQPGDGQKVMDQKSENRKTAIDGLGRAAGPAYGKAKPDPLGIR